jgi:hypothetical protein
MERIRLLFATIRPFILEGFQYRPERKTSNARNWSKEQLFAAPGAAQSTRRRNHHLSQELRSVSPAEDADHATLKTVEATRFKMIDMRKLQNNFLLKNDTIEEPLKAACRLRQKMKRMHQCEYWYRKVDERMVCREFTAGQNWASSTVVGRMLADDSGRATLLNRRCTSSRQLFPNV